MSDINTKGRHNCAITLTSAMRVYATTVDAELYISQITIDYVTITVTTTTNTTSNVGIIFNIWAKPTKSLTSTQYVY